MIAVALSATLSAALASSSALAFDASLLQAAPTAPAAPAAPNAPAAPTAPAAPAAPPMPWFTQLGYRSLDLQSRLNVLDQVVVVPDAATYLDEISRWTLQARWPVLIEDNAFTVRFLRAFKPSVVYRRASVGSALPSGEALQARVQQAIAHAWSATADETYIDAYKRLGFKPAGVVGASASDPAWTAAVALAAGRGQIVAWIDGSFGTASSVLDKPTFDLLDGAVTKSFADSGLRWAALGDELETFTLCRNVAFKASIPSPPGGWNPQLPARDDGPLALTDALCRNDKGQRYAFASQVPGDEARAAYMAMCSLFLSRSSVFMFNGYAGKGDAMFTQFGYAHASSALSAKGFVCTVKEGADASAITWRTMAASGLSADVILVNSAGNADFFELPGSATMWATDIPLLDKPAVLSMVHSFSLQQPDNAATIGGRWLDHGVYAYAGSVHEPYLVAFIPPRYLADRLLGLAPFLVANRQWEGDFIPQAWRVATIGDPLMTVPSPGLARTLPPRGAAAAATDITLSYVDMREEARAAMEATRKATDGAAHARAIRAVALLGDDRIASQLWEIAAAGGFGAAAASEAFGPLFRTGNKEAFTRAWQAATQANPQANPRATALAAANPTAEQRDMLWALWGTSLKSTTDRALVSLLQREVRKPYAHMDAEVLLPAVKRLLGRDAAATWLGELMLNETNATGKRRLGELQGTL